MKIEISNLIVAALGIIVELIIIVLVIYNYKKFNGEVNDK